MQFFLIAKNDIYNIIIFIFNSKLHLTYFSTIKILTKAYASLTSKKQVAIFIRQK